MLRTRMPDLEQIQPSGAESTEMHTLAYLCLDLFFQYIAHSRYQNKSAKYKLTLSIVRSGIL